MIPQLNTPNTVTYMHSVLLSSLQSEFNYHAASWMPNVLTAKKRQIALLESIISKYEDEKFNLEACSIYHGVTFRELTNFMNRTDIDLVMKDCMEKKYRQLPLTFIDRVSLTLEPEPVKEIRYATKPIGVPKGWRSTMVSVKELINQIK